PDLGPRLVVLGPDVVEPAPVPEALLAGRVLDDPVERHDLADHDLAHLGSPFIGRVRAASDEAPGATRIERRISGRPVVVTRDDRERKSEDATVTEQTLARARAGDQHAFRELTDAYRRELQLHIYRIVGSAQDAEDLLQEAALRPVAG